MPAPPLLGDYPQRYTGNVFQPTRSWHNHADPQEQNEGVPLPVAHDIPSTTTATPWEWSPCTILRCENGARIPEHRRRSVSCPTEPEHSG